MNRQDFIVNEFKKVANLNVDRKLLHRQFVYFAHKYGHNMTSRKAERILNMYNPFASLGGFKRAGQFYTQILM